MAICGLIGLYSVWVATRPHTAGPPRGWPRRGNCWARCTSCHKEHHGDASLVPSDSPLCTGCHARMPGRAQTIRDLAHHPELAVRAWSGTPPVLAKVALDRPNLRDQTQLKFSHDEHLGQREAGLAATRPAHRPTPRLRRSTSNVM